MEMLEIKNKIRQIKIFFSGLISRLDTTEKKNHGIESNYQYAG